MLKYNSSTAANGGENISSRRRTFYKGKWNGENGNIVTKPKVK